MLIEKLGRFFLALVFIYAGFVKIADPEGMRAAIEGYRVIGGMWSIFGAYFFPWLELMAGLGLIFRQTRLAASFTIAGLMTFFILILISAWARGLSLHCGCFGIESSEPDNYVVLVLRDVGLAVIAGYVFWNVVFQKNIPAKGS